MVGTYVYNYNYCILQHYHSNTIINILFDNLMIALKFIIYIVRYLLPRNHLEFYIALALRENSSSKVHIYSRQLQSNLSYVTFQGNSEIWSDKTGGRLIQV